MKKKNSKEAADFPGRFGALTWRPGDLMKNLETPGKTGRVDRYAFCVLLLSHFLSGPVCCRRVCLWANSLVTGHWSLNLVVQPRSCVRMRIMLRGASP